MSFPLTHLSRVEVVPGGAIFEFVGRCLGFAEPPNLAKAVNVVYVWDGTDASVASVSPERRAKIRRSPLLVILTFSVSPRRN